MENVMQIVSPVFWLLIPMLFISKLYHKKKYLLSMFIIVVIIGLQFVGEVFFHNKNYTDAFILSIAVGIAALLMTVSSSRLRKSQSKKEN